MTRRLSLWSTAVAVMLGAVSTAAIAQPATSSKPAAKTTAGQPTAKPAAKAATAKASIPVKPAITVKPNATIGGPPPPPPPGTMPVVKKLVGPPGVAAVVNGHKIMTKEVYDLAMRLAGPKVLDDMITNDVIDQEAKKQKVTVTAAEMHAKIAEARAQVAQQFPGQSLEQVLAKNHRTYAEYKDNVRVREEVEKLVAKNTKPIPMVHVRHILIATKNPMNNPTMKVHTDAEAKDIIKKIQDEMKAGASFEDLAKKYSEDPSNKDKGGDLGIVNQTTTFDPTFRTAALTLKKGQVTLEPVESIYGLHLIKADSTSDSPNADDKALYDAAIKQYQQQQMNTALGAYIQEIRAKAKVENYLDQ